MRQNETSHGGEGLQHLYCSSYYLMKKSNRSLVYTTSVLVSFGINFRIFLNML